MPSRRGPSDLFQSPRMKNFPAAAEVTSPHFMPRKSPVDGADEGRQMSWPPLERKLPSNFAFSPEGSGAAQSIMEMSEVDEVANAAGGILSADCFSNPGGAAARSR